MNRKYGFGIIGLGAIAGIHAAAINKIENAELTSVYDAIPERALDFSKKYGGKPYNDFEAFLRDTDTDFVTITTPSGYHQDVSIAAANAGKHLIIEKPLEITYERCKKIIDASEKNNVMLSSIFQSRFFDATLKIRQALDKGRFGKLILCDAYVKWYRSQEYYDSGAWRGTKEVDGGGALMNQAIHAIDLLLWFGGNVKEVSCRAATMAHDRIDVEDVLVSTLFFENGAMGTVTATTAVWPGSPKRIEILGTNGSVVIEEEAIIRWDFDKEEPEDKLIKESICSKGSNGGSGDPMSISYEGHKRQFMDCIKALETGAKPLIDGHSAAKSVILIEAMYKSADIKAVVSL
jgi:predicted dehydrogenase